jgi:hypothetical protein
MTVRAILFGLLPILWALATQAGADVMKRICRSDDRRRGDERGPRTASLRAHLRILEKAIAAAARGELPSVPQAASFLRRRSISEVIRSPRRHDFKMKLILPLVL